MISDQSVNRSKQKTLQIRQEEISLKHLREKLGLCQTELLQRLEVQQPAMSKLERRQNLELNTLRAVVNALGGSIPLRGRFASEIIVRVPNEEIILIIASFDLDKMILGGSKPC